jgi:DNA repair protein RecO (recombination protein O)
MEKQRAYVLHSRSYRETSAMVDLFTPDYGLIRCIARGIKRQMSQGQSLQPFIEYHIQFNGEGDLKNLEQYESIGLPVSLKGDTLFSGFYINEVLQRALRSEADVDSELLFEAYESVLLNLTSDNLEISLRQFELMLLEHMGQSYEWAMDFRNTQLIDASTHYGFYVEQGMSRVSNAYASKSPNSCFYGEDLLLLSQGNLENASTLKMSKRLLRLALRPIIGYKPLQARELLKQFRQISH